MKKKEEQEEDDVIFEPEEESSFKAKTPDKLKKKLKACEEERKEYLAGWQKARADLINLRKQDEIEKQHLRKFVTEDLISELISTLDSFDMAFANKESWEAVSKEWRVGVEYIYNQLLETLSRHGLNTIKPLDNVFDPQKHEAVEMVPGKNNIVVEVIQKGYELNGKVIRTAKVKVGTGENS